MKEDALYDFYVIFLESKFDSGMLSMLMISRNYFEEFKYKFNNNSLWALSLKRDKKINDIIDEKN